MFFFWSLFIIFVIDYSFIFIINLFYIEVFLFIECKVVFMLVKKGFFGFILVFLFVLLISFQGFSSNGKDIFETSCSVCHTIGSGRLVGPDLKNVHGRRSDEWIKQFIKSSQSMIQKGNQDAIDIFNEYGKMPMPDHMHFSDSDLALLLNYIKEESIGGEGSEIVSKKKIILEKLQPEEVLLGQQLFSGNKRFENNGPSCISCHNVRAPDIISGGSLAIDLTGVYSRISDQGVSAILKAPPFPAMASAYESKKLDEDEIFALKAFLRNTKNEYSEIKPYSYGSRLFLVGVVGVIIFLGVISVVWGNRKKYAVNKDIFDRQIKSE